MNDEILTVFASVDNILMKLVNVRVGTVELYANGAMNIYLKQDNDVTGFVIYRR